MAVLITYGELVFINDDAISLSPWLNAAISSVPLFAIGIVMAIALRKSAALERENPCLLWLMCKNSTKLSTNLRIPNNFFSESCLADFWFDCYCP